MSGPEAEAYLADHLRRTPEGTYSCPDTGMRWHVDEETDPRQPRPIRLPR